MFDKHAKIKIIAGTLPTGERVTAKTRKGHDWIVAVQENCDTPMRTWGAGTQDVAQQQADFHTQRHDYAVGLVCRAQ